MIYIIGSGFSGLTTAFILRKKYKNITVISPSKKERIKKSGTLLKYLLTFKGETKFNSNKVSNKISSIEKTTYKIINLYLLIKTEVVKYLGWSIN